MASPVPPAEEGAPAKQPDLHEPEGFVHPLHFKKPPVRIVQQSHIGAARRALKDDPDKQAEVRHKHIPEEA